MGAQMVITPALPHEVNADGSTPAWVEHARFVRSLPMVERRGLARNDLRALARTLGRLARRAQGLPVVPLCGGDRMRRGCAFADGSAAPVVVVVDGRGYCGYHSPVTVSVPARGVSLGKATDRDIPGVVTYVTSEGELDYRRSLVNPRVDSVVSVGVSRGVDRNEPMALARAFAQLAH